MFTTIQLQEQINAYFSAMQIVKAPKGLYEPIEYILAAGGKRIRPVLMLMAYNLYKDKVEEVYAPAAGIEIFHNYTLLHDDLMDRADMRRGRKTVHKVWDDNTAILSGDLMLVLAYQYIAACPVHYLKQVLDLFSATATEICEGQQYDVDFEQRNDVKEEEYIEMIRLKTAVLLAASLKMGAIQGGSSQEDADLLYEFGINVGLAFQLKDDYLDVYGDPAVFGKNIGGDILCDKKTYMLINVLERANPEQLRELNQWIGAQQVNPQEKIAAVTAIYNQVGIKELCEEKMNFYYEKAVTALNRVSVAPEKKKELQELIHNLMYREK
ncbi:polyprenyl synthetase family protein [Bacteroides sp. 214]|uniref:polyprenyl synthetase family protein n=1 Tax=Bacteroides sp. 214 TaxID=2302935 RepID=UPI0013D73F91|nr:polyprenyl synthetase family protein [Bacteroides sp. 214]NDW13407.1 polyprenyl synthetase family protein [Bacteroides sp. 214]